MNELALANALEKRVAAVCVHLKSIHPNAPHKYCNDLLSKIHAADDLKMSDLFPAHDNHRTVPTNFRDALIEVLEKAIEKLPAYDNNARVVKHTPKEVKMKNTAASNASSYVSTLVSLRKVAKTLNGVALDEEMSARFETIMNDGVEARIAAFAEFASTK